MRFFDLFAGIGGFRKGLENHKHKCVGYCEIDVNARKSYDAIFDVKDDEPYYKDATSLDGKSLPPFELLCGGFPCQPFSRAGRRKGFNDHRQGNLFFDIVRIIEGKKPLIVFLENVKGLLTSGENKIHIDGDKKIIEEASKGSTFTIILQYLNDLGYDVEWELINSAHYIAHKRERVYIVARRRIPNAFKRIFPIHMPPKIISTYDRSIDSEYVYGDFIPFIEKGTLKKYNINTEGLFNEAGKEFRYGKVSPWGTWGLMINGTCYTAKIQFKPQTIYPLKDKLLDIREVNEKYFLSKKELDQQRYAKQAKTWTASGNKMGNMSFPDNPNKPSRTLTANSSGREMMVLEDQIDGLKIYRKLTALEYWRLQGFSDEDFNKAIKAGVPESQLKKQAGNAVTVDVIKNIAPRLEIIYSDLIESEYQISS